jgi:response regulator RpfG family c-di-GMP phosphodiesterase
MMELRNKDQAGHCKRVAKLARGIAIEMGLSTPEIDKLYYSGLLHDVGKIHLSTKLLGTAYSNLSAEDKAEYQQHSVLGEILLTPLDQFHHISHFIRHHHEHYNGRGFPDRLKGDRIPLGAAILSVADDFDEACSGFTFDKLVPLEESRQIIADGSGESYHPEVVSAFLLAQEKLSQQDLCVDKISSENVTQGMRLTKDLIRPDGVLLLTSNTELTDQHIQKIQQLEGVQKMKFELWVSRVK